MEINSILKRLEFGTRAFGSSPPSMQRSADAMPDEERGGGEIINVERL